MSDNTSIDKLQQQRQEKLEKYLDTDTSTANDERRRQFQEFSELPEVIVHGSGRRTIHNQVFNTISQFFLPLNFENFTEFSCWFIPTL